MQGVGKERECAWVCGESTRPIAAEEAPETTAEVTPIDGDMDALEALRGHNLYEVREWMHEGMPGCDTDMDRVYRNQIEQAQRFVDENEEASVFQVKALLQTILPPQYREDINGIHRNRTVTVINNEGTMQYIRLAENVVMSK